MEQWSFRRILIMLDDQGNVQRGWRNILERLSV